MVEEVKRNNYTFEGTSYPKLHQCTWHWPFDNLIKLLPAQLGLRQVIQTHFTPR